MPSASTPTRCTCKAFSTNKSTTEHYQFPILTELSSPCTVNQQIFSPKNLSLLRLQTLWLHSIFGLPRLKVTYFLPFASSTPTQAYTGLTLLMPFYSLCGSDKLRSNLILAPYRGVWKRSKFQLIYSSCCKC